MNAIATVCPVLHRVRQCKHSHQTLMLVQTKRGNYWLLKSKTASLTLFLFGAAIFQGCNTSVGRQIQVKYIPFCQSVHCFACKCTLAFKPLSQVSLIMAVELLFQSSYNYFAHSPKCSHEFTKLNEAIESQGLKLLKNIATRWVSILDLLKRLQANIGLSLRK